MRKVWTFDPFLVRETLVGVRATLHRFRAIGREWEEGREKGDVTKSQTATLTLGLPPKIMS